MHTRFFEAHDLHDLLPILGIVAFVVAACLALEAWLALRVRATLARGQARAQAVRAQRGEREAEKLLRDAGYRVIERQRRASYVIEVDARPNEVELIFDLVVERDGERYVAEVKTGEQAPRLSRAETRRQLLEYQLATDTRAVLLVDPEARTLTKVRFPLPRARAERRHGFVFALASALLVAWWWTTRA